MRLESTCFIHPGRRMTAVPSTTLIEDPAWSQHHSPQKGTDVTIPIQRGVPFQPQLAAKKLLLQQLENLNLYDRNFINVSFTDAFLYKTGVYVAFRRVFLKLRWSNLLKKGLGGGITVLKPKTIMIIVCTLQRKVYQGGPTEIRTRALGFKVQCRNH